jgi:hypothetical protein
MSLTSYRAAPPRVRPARCGWRAQLPSVWRVASCFRDGRPPPPPWPLSGLPGRPSDPAATRSPAPWGAVPWARRGFTAEFGTGSGGAPALWPPGRAGVPDGGAGEGLGWLAWHGDVVRPSGGGAAAGAGELSRAIRTGRLRASPRLHPRPIDVVVCHGPVGETRSCGGFPA